MNNINNLAFDLNYVSGIQEGIIYMLENAKINRKDLLPLLTKEGRITYNQIKTKIKRMSKKTEKVVSMSDTTYTKICKAVKRNSSRKTGLVSKSPTELGEIVGVSSRTVNRGLNKMITAKLLKKEGVTKLATYFVILK